MTMGPVFDWESTAAVKPHSPAVILYYARSDLGHASSSSPVASSSSAASFSSLAPFAALASEREFARGPRSPILSSMERNGMISTPVPDSRAGFGRPFSSSAAHHPPYEPAMSTVSAPGGAGPLRIVTQNLRHPRESPFTMARSENTSPEEPPSVIHKPAGFDGFFSRPASSQAVEKPGTPALPALTSSPKPLLKARPAERNGTENGTGNGDISVLPSPLANERRPPKTRVKSNLEDIQEQTDTEGEAAPRNRTARSVTTTTTTSTSTTNTIQQDVGTLKVALGECWTLCNTLESLSLTHRSRTFRASGVGDAPEQAWKTCWKLCRELYDGWGKAEASSVNTTLEICREFCRCLFGIRKRGDDVSDSILRVSFELNNHLYNTADRNLPNAFRERTLDFYLTMCHRMMKQRTCLPTDADALLGSCWALTEILFSLRQSLRDDKDPDEELLSSAVQACWDLCDMFREGWTRVRPDRATPRPAVRTTQNEWTEGTNSNASSGYTSPPSPMPSGSSSAPSQVSGSSNSQQLGIGIPPDTPTTINQGDQSDSADDMPGQILVLGHGRRMSDQSSFTTSSSNNSQNVRVFPNNSRAPSSNRNAVRIKQPSQHSSVVSSRNGSVVSSVISAGIGPTTSRSTASAPSRSQPTEMDDVTLVKMLIVRAAFNAGYSKYQRAQGGSGSRTGPETTVGAAIHLTAMSLTAFVLTLPVGAFGMEPWQSKLLSNFKHAARSTQLFHNLPFGRRAYVTNIIKAVINLSSKEPSLNWLNALFEWVMGFPTNKALPIGLSSAFISTVENE